MLAYYLYRAPTPYPVRTVTETIYSDDALGMDSINMKLLKTDSIVTAKLIIVYLLTNLIKHCKSFGQDYDLTLPMMCL